MKTAARKRGRGRPARPFRQRPQKGRCGPRNGRQKPDGTLVHRRPPGEVEDRDVRSERPDSFVSFATSQFGNRAVCTCLARVTRH